MTADLTEKHKRAEGLLALAPGRAPPPGEMIWVMVIVMITMATVMMVMPTMATVMMVARFINSGTHIVDSRAHFIVLCHQNGN